MIPANAPNAHCPEQAQEAPWQSELRHACRDLDALLAHLGLSRDDFPQGLDPRPDFPLRVPWPFVARMRPGDPMDPLLRQVLPLAEERRAVDGFVTDPVGDGAAQALPGLLHKYHGRILLTVTGACGVHCRYCFRRHFPYAEANPGTGHLAATRDYLLQHPEVQEVILSGGDPLSLPDSRLETLIRALEDIPHLSRLRLHTRQPVVLPSRVTDGLVQMLESTRLRPVVVVHINHAQEIDATLGMALARLRKAGVALYNQAVLLAGVNDTLAAQQALAEKLFDSGVQPLYVHLLDRVSGAAHFEVAEDEAVALFERLRGRLPGYLMPRLVREEPGAHAKLPRA